MPAQAFHPAFAAIVKYARDSISDDPDTAVAQTIQKMAEYVRQDRASPYFRSLAGQLRGASSSETKSRVFAWIKSRVRFVSDSSIAALLGVPESELDRSSIAEVLIRPLDLVQMVDRMGDCDDFSMLGACILTAAGIPCAFVTLAADAREPSQYSHVYVLADHEAFDSSHGPFVGWEARNRFGKRQLWSVETGMPILQRAGFGLGDVIPTADLYDSGGANLVTISTPLPDISMPAVTAAPGSFASLFPTADFSNLPLPTLNSGGGGAIDLTGGGSSSATPWWSSLISGALGTASSILKMQYLPQNAVIQTRPGSFIATGTAASSGALAVGAGTGSAWLWILLAVLALFLLMGRKR